MVFLMAANFAALVNRYLAAVERYDVEELGEDRPLSSFMSLEETARRWRKMVAAVIAIERALKNPLAPGSLVALLAANDLASHMTEACPAVAAVGEAIATRGDNFCVEVFRAIGVPVPKRRNRDEGQG
jgi:hypothetical protein